MGPSSLAIQLCFELACVQHCVIRPLLGLVIWLWTGQIHQVAGGGEKGDRKIQNIIIYIHVYGHRTLAGAVKK